MSRSPVPQSRRQVTSIERLSADATVNLRKGRKFVSFDVSFVVKWQGVCRPPAPSRRGCACVCAQLALATRLVGARLYQRVHESAPPLPDAGFAPSGVVDRVTNGELAVSDLMADDVASDFQLRLSFAGSTAFDTTCRDLMAGKGAAAVRAAVRAFAAELTAHDDALEAAATAATAQVPSPAAPAAAPASVPAACEGSGPATAVARRVEAAAPPRPHAADEADAGGDGLERDVARLAIGAAMRSGHAVTSGVAVKTPPADATPVPGEPSEPSRTVPGEHSRTVHREREPSAPALREPSIRAAVVAPAVTATTVMAAAATSVPAAATGAEAPAGVGPVGRAGAVTGGRSGDGGGGGSEWNAGSFHWEERPLTAWATQRCVLACSRATPVSNHMPPRKCRDPISALRLFPPHVTPPTPLHPTPPAPARHLRTRRPSPSRAASRSCCAAWTSTSPAAACASSTWS